MGAELPAEQRLAVSRAIGTQSLRQPAWLLLAQRMGTHAMRSPDDPSPPNPAAELLTCGLTALLNALHRPAPHAAHHSTSSYEGTSPPPEA